MNEWGPHTGKWVFAFGIDLVAYLLDSFIQSIGNDIRIEWLVDVTTVEVFIECLSNVCAKAVIHRPMIFLQGYVITIQSARTYHIVATTDLKPRKTIVAARCTV